MSVTQIIIYVVTVNNAPACAFHEESAAQYYIDHHDAPNLCAIHEIALIDRS